MHLIQGTSLNPTHAHRIAKRSIPAALNFNEETFAAQVVPNKPHFVMFFVPWCGWSRRLYPTWQNLAVEYNQNYENEQEVVIGKVDCTIESALCDSQDVRGYPTLKFFKYGPDSGVMDSDFRGGNDDAGKNAGSAGSSQTPKKRHLGINRK